MRPWFEIGLTAAQILATVAMLYVYFSRKRLLNSALHDLNNLAAPIFKAQGAFSSRLDRLNLRIKVLKTRMSLFEVAVEQLEAKPKLGDSSNTR